MNFEQMADSVYPDLSFVLLLTSLPIIILHMQQFTTTMNIYIVKDICIRLASKQKRQIKTLIKQ